MNKLINCPRCGTLFLSSKWEICDDCYNEYFELFQSIIDFIKASEGVHINDIIENFEIRANEIERFLSQGKLIDCASKLNFNCTSCGKLTTAEHCFSFVCVDCSKKIKEVIGPSKKLIKLKITGEEPLSG